MKYQILILLVLFTIPIVKAQTTSPPPLLQTLDSSGGEGTGEEGSVSFSVGQVSYTTITTSSDIVYQGVQIPAFLPGIMYPVTEPLTLDIQAYPNPATDYFVIEIKNYEDEDLNYGFYDLQGKLLESKPLTSSKTKVYSANLQAAVYFLKIRYKNSPIRTIKIIKR